MAGRDAEPPLPTGESPLVHRSSAKRSNTGSSWYTVMRVTLPPSTVRIDTVRSAPDAYAAKPASPFAQMGGPPLLATRPEHPPHERAEVVRAAVPVPHRRHLEHDVVGKQRGEL